MELLEWITYLPFQTYSKKNINLFAFLKPLFYLYPMEKPKINDYPLTDSRTFLEFDGTINWQKYAKALDEYILLKEYNNESPLKEQSLFMDILNDERDENS